VQDSRLRTIFARTRFKVGICLRMIFPPLYSFQRLERYCRAKLAKDATAYLPRMFLANLYKDHLKNEEAKREFTEIRRLGQLTDQDRLNLGEVLYRLKDYQEAIEALTPVIERYRNEKHANWYLGISYFEIGNFGRARVYLERAVARGVQRRDDYWRLGVCYDRLGELQKATDAYVEALKDRSDSEDLKQNLASVYVRIGKSLMERNPEQAKRELRKALELRPGDQDAVQLLSILEGRAAR